MSFIDLTVFIAKIFFILKIVEIIFGLTITVLVLFIVGYALNKNKKNISYTITTNEEQKQ